MTGFTIQHRPLAESFQIILAQIILETSSASASHPGLRFQALNRFNGDGRHFNMPGFPPAIGTHLRLDADGDTSCHSQDSTNKPAILHAPRMRPNPLMERRRRNRASGIGRGDRRPPIR